jgi:hypothetical protein
MSKKTKQSTRNHVKTTPTFLLELPLQVSSQQARHLRGHFEAARHLYHALLGEAMKRLRHMRADARWQQARLIPRSNKQARKAAFAALRKEFGFSEYALHTFATQANTSWIADHLDATTAQTLASRAYQAANRVCVGKARRVRFCSKGRGLSSLEGKTNTQGIRFVLQPAQEGNQGWLVWGEARRESLRWYPILRTWCDPRWAASTRPGAPLKRRRLPFWLPCPIVEVMYPRIECGGLQSSHVPNCKPWT